MHFLLRIIVLFLIVFNFRIPVLYNSVVISIIICVFYYIVNKKSLPFTYFTQRYNAIILIGTLVLAFIIFIIEFLHNTEIMSGREKRTLVEFMMLWAVVFALPLLIDGKESKAFEELAILICYVFALQGIISLAGFLYAPFGDFLFSMKPEELREADVSGAMENKFRFYNLSGVLLVELTAAFGAAFMIFLWLQLKSNHPYMRGWIKFIVFGFIFIGTIFSGRTGFLGLLIGLGGWFLFSISKIFKLFQQNIGYIIIISLIILFSYNGLLSNKMRQSFNDDVFPFAFEWYYNYRDYGRFEVGSMEATPEHYYYIHDETLLKGHGVEAFGKRVPIYPHSDAGYTNTLVFGGIPLLLCLIIYQCLYFIRPIAISLKNNSRNNRINCVFFLLLFIYIFIVDIKAPAIGYLHIVETLYLALGSSYIIQYNLQNEQDEVT